MPLAMRHFEGWPPRSKSNRPSRRSASRLRSIRPRLKIRQKRGEQADQRQERTDLIDKYDVGSIGQFPQQRRADTAHPKRQTKKDAGDHTDPARHELLSKD